MIDIDPNSSGLPGIEQLRGRSRRSHDGGPDPQRSGVDRQRDHLGLRLQLVQPASGRQGKIGVLISCGAAVVCGASVTLINFFWGVGQAV